MFEKETYENILKRALKRVPGTIDKRQGSVLYDALAPACAEISKMYIELDNMLKLMFANTSNGKYLESRCEEFGVKRRPATKAIRKGIFEGALPPIGSRFGMNDLTYIVVDNSKGIGNVQLECEQSGTEGNKDIGFLIPIQDIKNLKTAQLTEILIPGDNIETDESLYERYRDKISKPATSGNVYHYIQWAREVKGVGGAKVFPLFKGNGTVKVIVVDQNKKPPTNELIKKVDQHIEQLRPIGADVTVEGARPKNITINAKVQLATKYTLKNVQDMFIEELEKFRNLKAFKDTYISYAAIGNILFNTDGVIDYSDLTINGNTKNLEIGDEEIIIFDLVNLKEE